MWGREGIEGETEEMQLMYNVSVIVIPTMNPPLYNDYILIKNYKNSRCFQCTEKIHFNMTMNLFDVVCYDDKLD
jgi:hypothetical protein